LTIYLTADDVLRINEKFCGTDQLRDFGLLDAAANRPQASAFGEDAFPTVHEKAAALLHALARNHPFVTGNKRTAWTATAMFYLVNGYNLVAEAGEVIGLTVDAAEGQQGVADIAAVLKAWAQPFDTTEEWVFEEDEPGQGKHHR
jgi:death-on-curing protein